MKLIALCLLLFLPITEIYSQTLIGTSSYPFATANHNQRKIVRNSIDNIYIVFVDSTIIGKVINGVNYDSNTGNWSDVNFIADGENPTLTIFDNGKIVLVYESNDSLSRIKYTSSEDFKHWTASIVVSDSMCPSKIPVADIDSTGDVNIFWIQYNGDNTQSLIYSVVKEDTLFSKKSVTTKGKIHDIAIANHLQNNSNDLVFAIQFSEDSLQFFKSSNKLMTIDTLYSVIGSSPCISYNSHFTIDDPVSAIRLLYLDESDNLFEVEILVADDIYTRITQLSNSQIDYICIDDLLPPIGYSYIYVKKDTLYHEFSYGRGSASILDTITNNPILPSIAYKNFSMEYIDYIWMEQFNQEYNIYYKRDEKVIYIEPKGIENKQGERFSLFGYPNPFKDQLNISVVVQGEDATPILEIYDMNSRLLRILNYTNISANEYFYSWDAITYSGELVVPGIYIILCTVDNIKSARKVIHLE